LSILCNDGNGDFSERQDVWVTGNQSRNAEWDSFANVEQVEVGEFTGDNAPDIVIYQKNNPFKTDDQGQPAGEPGNITIIKTADVDRKIGSSERVSLTFGYGTWLSEMLTKRVEMISTSLTSPTSLQETSGSSPTPDRSPQTLKDW